MIKSIKRNFITFSMFTRVERLELLLALILMRLNFGFSEKNRWRLLKKQKDELDFLQLNGFIISKANSDSHINVRSHNGNFKTLLRKFSSDFKVFEQVTIGEEYKLLIELVAKYSQSENIKTIVDAGANIGLTTLFFKEFFPQATCFLIEADISNFKFLQENINYSGIKGTKLLNRALWHKEQFLSISDSFRDGAEWGKQVSENVMNDIDQIRSITLIGLLKEEKIEQINILKIDIEGAEKYLFQDSDSRQVMLSKVQFVALEIHEEEISKEQVFSILKGMDFLIFDQGETSFAMNRNLL